MAEQSIDKATPRPEEWRIVPRTRFEISSWGRVRHAKSKQIIEPRPWSKHISYLRVNHSLDGRSISLKVHHLVAEAFIGKRSAEIEVNHKDGNKQNNHVSNLEYVTKLENIRHAVENKLHAFGERHGSARLSEKDIAEIRRLGQAGKHSPAIAALFNVHPTTIQRVLSGKRWKHVAALEVKNG